MEIISSNLQVIVSVLTIVGILIKIVLWLRKKIALRLESTSRVNSQVEAIFKEIIPNGGGSIKDKINVMSLEITENTKLTQQIFHRQRWIMDRREEPIFETTITGEYIWVNRPFSELVGRDRDELMGHNWKNSIHEEDRQRAISNWQSSVHEGRAYEDEYRIVTPQGKIKKVSATAVNSNGHGYVGYLEIIDKKS